VALFAGALEKERGNMMHRHRHQAPFHEDVIEGVLALFVIMLALAAVVSVGAILGAGVLSLVGYLLGL